MDWPSATTISAPIAPGDFSAPKETASVTTTMSKAPAACAFSASPERSLTRPKTSGICTTTQEVSPSHSASKVLAGSARRP